MNNNQNDLNEILVQREVYTCLTPIIEFLLCVEGDRSGNEPPFTWDDIENIYQDCGNCPYCVEKQGDACEEQVPQEILEWWAVSPWLFERLREEGEPVIDTYPQLWGRTTSGQQISVDGVITRIQKKTGYASEGTQ